MAPPAGAGVAGLHAKFPQGQCVEHTGVAGGMLQHKRVVRRGFIQQALVRRALFPQCIVVIPARHHPLPCRDIVFTDKAPYRFPDIVIALRPLQAHLQKRVGIAGKMAVRVDECRQQGAARKVHPLCARAPWRQAPPAGPPRE